MTLHTDDIGYPDSFSFAGPSAVVYDLNGTYLKPLDLDTRASPILSRANPPDRALRAEFGSLVP